MKNVLLTDRTSAEALEELKSRVDEVTVFADRALVTRVMKVDLQAGENRISFSSLGRGIIEESIKVSLGSSGAKLTATELETKLLWSYRAQEHVEIWEKARATVKKLAEALDGLAVVSLENRVLAELREYLRQSLSSILLEQETSMQKLREAMGFLEARSVDSMEKLIERKAAYIALERLLASFKAELERISHMDKKESVSIILTLGSQAAEQVEIRLSYILPGVSWKPVYDSFLETDAGIMKFKYFGMVRQSCGEAWDDARLSLSTAAVELSSEIPQVYPLTLSAQFQKREKTVVVANQAIESLDGLCADEVGAPPDAESSLSEGGAAQGADDVVKTQAISACFSVQGRASIPSDGLWHRFPIIEKDFPVKASFECVPELLEYVYVKASFVNDSGLPFLAGTNHVYRNGSYVGRAPLAYLAPGEKLDISFGIDDDLRVKRILLLREYRPAQGLLGKNVFELRVKFLLSNFKGKAQQVRLKEAVYLSEIKEVGVRIHEGTSPGWEKDAEGIVTWDVSLEPDPVKAVERELRYLVESGKAFDLRAVCG